MVGHRLLPVHEFSDGTDDFTPLIVRGFRIDRQSQNFFGDLFADRVIPFLAAQIGKAFLQMQRERIVNIAADLPFAQKCRSASRLPSATRMEYWL